MAVGGSTHLTWRKDFTKGTQVAPAEKHNLMDPPLMPLPDKRERAVLSKETVHRSAGPCQLTWAAGKLNFSCSVYMYRWV